MRPVKSFPEHPKSLQHRDRLPSDTSQVIVGTALGILALWGVVYGIRSTLGGREVEPGSWSELAQSFYPVLEVVARIFRLFRPYG